MESLESLSADYGDQFRLCWNPAKNQVDEADGYYGGTDRTSIEASATNNWSTFEVRIVTSTRIPSVWFTYKNGENVACKQYLSPLGHA